MLIEDLREFVSLSRTMNFTRTASEHFVSQSTISNHIAKMERELGMTLIDRTQGRVRLTPDGCRFLETAVRMIDEYDGFLARHHGTGDDKETRITVQVMQHDERAASVLLSRIRDFNRLHPGIDIELVATLRDDLLDQMGKGEADCGFWGISLDEPVIDDDFELVPFLREELVVWLDRSSPYFTSLSFTPHDLRAFSTPVWVGQGTFGLADILQQLAQRYGITLRTSPRYCRSVDDFMVNRVRDGDALVLTRGTEVKRSIGMRAERGLRTFNPPIYADAFIAFRSAGSDRDPQGTGTSPREGNGSALTEFRNYLERCYESDPMANDVPYGSEASE